MNEDDLNSIFDENMIDNADTRFISNINVDGFIQKDKNQNTKRKTKLFRQVLSKHSEIIEIHKSPLLY